MGWKVKCSETVIVYRVRTDRLDGKPQDFEVKYVFGVHPLQQYMVELPQKLRKKRCNRASSSASRNLGCGDQTMVLFESTGRRRFGSLFPVDNFLCSIYIEPIKSGPYLKK